ncbi:MAG: hypothetical protein DRP82_02800 [Planctomycetota bacterium]|nr:MAG: hypothetical protein DRP82_02800 [Planctomycetota bacterium]
MMAKCGRRGEKTGDVPVLDVKVRNLGPVRKADLQIKPFTVFIGPNNSGKSYLALMVHCIISNAVVIQRQLLYEVERIVLSHVRSRRKLLDLGPEKCLADAVVETWKRTFPDRMVELFACESLEDLVSVGASSMTVETLGVKLEIAKGNIGEDQLRVVPEGRDPWSLREFGARMKKMFKEAEKVFGKYPPDRGLSSFMMLVERELGPFMQKIIFAESSHYLPAGKCGILSSFEVLSAAAIDLLQSALGWKELRLPAFPGAIAEFIQALLMHRAQSGSDRRVSAVLENIVKDITGGEVRLLSGQRGKPVEIKFIGEGYEIPIRRASSSISEIAPVVFFVGLPEERRAPIRFPRYRFRGRETLLIIEEPEAHLDARNQVLFTRLLAFLVRNGVRVLITTHSDYVLEQVSNLVLCGMQDEKTKKKFARFTDGQEYVLPEEVSVYLMREGGRKHRWFDAVPVEIREEGIAADHMEEVKAQLYNEFVALWELQHAKTASAQETEERDQTEQAE